MILPPVKTKRTQDFSLVWKGELKEHESEVVTL